MKTDSNRQQHSCRMAEIRQALNEHKMLMKVAGFQEVGDLWLAPLQFRSHDDYLDNRHLLAWHYEYKGAHFFETDGRRIFRMPAANRYWPCLYVGRRHRDLDWREAVPLAYEYVRLRDIKHRLEKERNRQHRQLRKPKKALAFPKPTEEALRDDFSHWLKEHRQHREQYDADDDDYDRPRRDTTPKVTTSVLATRENRENSPEVRSKRRHLEVPPGARVTSTGILLRPIKGWNLVKQKP